MKALKILTIASIVAMQTTLVFAQSADTKKLSPKDSVLTSTEYVYGTGAIVYIESTAGLALIGSAIKDYSARPSRDGWAVINIDSNASSLKMDSILAKIKPSDEVFVDEYYPIDVSVKNSAKLTTGHDLSKIPFIKTRTTLLGSDTTNLSELIKSAEKLGARPIVVSTLPSFSRSIGRSLRFTAEQFGGKGLIKGLAGISLVAAGPLTIKAREKAYSELLQAEAPEMIAQPRRAEAAK